MFTLASACFNILDLCHTSIEWCMSGKCVAENSALMNKCINLYMYIPNTVRTELEASVIT